MFYEPKVFTTSTSFCVGSGTKTMVFCSLQRSPHPWAWDNRMQGWTKPQNCDHLHLTAASEHSAPLCWARAPSPGMGRERQQQERGRVVWLVPATSSAKRGIKASHSSKSTFETDYIPAFCFWKCVLSQKMHKWNTFTISKHFSCNISRGTNYQKPLPTSVKSRCLCGKQNLENISFPILLEVKTENT